MRQVIALLTVVAALSAAAAAFASSPPVGPLPAGLKATVTTHAGELVAVALPHRSGGRVWRIARAFDGKILTEVSEADVGTNVVIVFKALHAGKVTVTFALTKGETAKALDARTFEVHVR
ncbi:MAG TPA: hypothetical protein VGG88_11755 [Gaiellaceae bacterium]|jgi:hypothetical protein